MSTKKRYVNQSIKMQIISFTDGSATFLFRGQAIETDKEVKHMDDGIRVKDIKAQRKKSESKSVDAQTENE